MIESNLKLFLTERVYQLLPVQKLPLYMEALGGEESECFHLTEPFHIGDTSP